VNTVNVQPPWTIDELARVAELPSRTIREYQTVGVLMPPKRDGRRGLYDVEHRSRLALIARLQARGYSLAGIRDLLSAWEEGTSLQTLVHGGALGDTAFDETPTHFTADALASRIAGMDDPNARRRGVRAGLFVEVADGYIARSVALVDLVGDAVSRGAPLDAALDAVRAARKGARDQARAFTDLFVAYVWSTDDPGGSIGLARRSRLRIAQSASSLIIDELGIAITRAAASDARLAQLVDRVRIGAVLNPEKDTP
ncbi:MAG: MerR family transcriptional regulator, partial [Acidimicrobiia bacterium]